MFVSELISELSLPTQSKYVRLQIRGRQQIQLSTGTKYMCTSLARAFGLQNNKYVAFVVNCSTPASPFYGVFWRKGSGRRLALNQSRGHVVPRKYHPLET